MTVSRINVFASVALVSLGLGFARADDAPAPQPAGQDDTTVPDAPDAPNTTGPIIQSNTVAVGDINVVDGDPVGTLDDTTGGFGRDMWVNAQRDTLEQFLSGIPVASRNPIVRDLARRLLLTRSEAPVGLGKRALVSIRIEKLLDVGLVDEAGELAATARLPKNTDFALVQAKAILLAGRTADACGDATAQRLENGDPLWLQLRAYCFAVAGDQTQVDLIDQLLDAQGKTDADYKLLRDDALQHLNYMPGLIGNPSPIHVFLLKAAHLPVPMELAVRFHLNVAQPVLEAAPTDYPVTPDAVSQAALAFGATGNANAQRRAALTIGLADALGMPLPPNAQTALQLIRTTQWAGSRPTQQEYDAIGEAAMTQGRRGEAILRLIETLDARDLGDLAPDAVAQFVRLLRQLDLNDEASLLAVQALRDYRDPPPAQP